jgi:sulfur carrier protein
MLTTQTIGILVNGEQFEVPEGGNVSRLLAHLNIASDRVAVELNKELVRKRDWDSTPVADGARVEIVEFVGGG